MTYMTSLAYVGSRPYIRGGDLFNWLERSAEAEFGAQSRPHLVVNFKITREVERDGHWTFANPKGGSSAQTVFQDQLGRRRNAWFIEDGEMITRRDPDIGSRLQSLAETAEFEGRAQSTEINNSTALIDLIIEANKKLHSAVLKRRGLPDGSIRFLYLENLCIPELPQSMISLEFTHMGERPGPGRTFSLSNARFGNGSPFRICYSF